MEYQEAIRQIQDWVEKGKNERTQTGQRNYLERIMRVAATSNVLPFEAMFQGLSAKSGGGVVKKQDENVRENVPKPLHFESSLSAEVKCAVPGCNAVLKNTKALNGHMKKHRNV